MAPIMCGGSVLGVCFVIQFFMSFTICNHSDGEERTGWLLYFVFLLSCVCVP